MAIRFARNLSRADDIRHHLTLCSASFVPALDSRVTIPSYAAKLALRAERFEAWSEGVLVGLVAMYCPAPSQAGSGKAFVSNVSVAPTFSRRGIARHLLSDAIGHARTCSSRIALEVDRRSAALRLYRTLGFAVEAAHDDDLTLLLTLG